MPIFNYSARDNGGKIMRGTVEAGNEKEAAALIRERSLFLTSLVSKQETPLSFSLKQFQKNFF